VQLRILLADDHASIRHMIRAYLELHPGWEVCGEAADGVEAVQRSAELQPDIVLMDLDMPRLNGLDATRRIHKSSPSVRVLILTLHDNVVLPKIARESGAHGYVLKTQAFDLLTKAIETVGKSGSFFPSSTS